MRRLLVGGLGLALGLTARPAVAQDAANGRAARLGRPVAASPAPSGVAPAGGVTARGQFPPPPVTSPASAPVPLATPLPRLGPPTAGGPTPLGQPRGLGQGPTVTLVRDGGAQAGPAAGLPTLAPSGAYPPVGPYPGSATAVPVPNLDPPLVAGGPGHDFPALRRLRGTGAVERAWFSGEYLLWWTRSTQLPVLAATGPVPADPNGMVITPTPILAGSFGQTLHGGGRFGGGWWFSDDQRRGVDARFFFLGRNGSEFVTNSAAYPVLGRPFFNPNPVTLADGSAVPAGPLTDVIGAPGRFSGGISVQLDNTVWGAEANFRRYLAGCGCWRVDGLVGYRYLNFKETLTITEAGVITDPAVLAAGRAPIASATDRFRAENDFHGGQIGVTGEVRRGRWFVDGRASIAFGTVFQTAEISGGQTQAFPDGRVAQFQGGLLALPGANIGRHTQNRFAVLPEVGLNLGYHVTDRMRVFAGYNFLYLSSVLRPANVIDPVVDAARVPNFLPTGTPPLPGTPRPAPRLDATDFFAQGVSFGVQWTW